MSPSLATVRADDVYGRRLGDELGANDGPFMVTRSLPNTEIAITDVRIDTPLGRLSDPIAHTDAYSLSLVLRELPETSYWEDGRQVATHPIRAGESLLHDLRRSPRVLVDKPMHLILLYLPQTALDALADESNAPRITQLRYEPGLGVRDETVRSLGQSLRPALRAPDQVSRLFVDHLTLAMAAHVAQTYGGMLARSNAMRGGLAAWQEKRAKDMLAADLTGGMSLKEIALACGLSVSHFARAFRRSTGQAPHAWLQRHRVELAKAMLQRRDHALADIALACGFANQSHFTRVFSAQVGLSPGVWRRAHAD
jgi:AraC-like DNA-binding protein